MDKERIAYLVKQYRTGAITEAERKELFDLVGDNSRAKLVHEGIALDMEATEPAAIEEEKWKPVLQKILDLDRDGRHRLPGVSRSGPRVIPMFRWIAAAVFIGVLALAVVRLLTNNHKDKSETTIAQTHDVPAPKNTRAVITLADGSKVYLDSVTNGTIAQEDNVNVTKSNNGEIRYSANGEQRTPNNLAYNTLSNPRGSKVISLTLADGTKVWLNSESSLRYPASFAPSAFREVEIIGEAYFEVKHDAKQPFKVHLPNGSIVEDLGTAFNINAYPDETDIKTTLVEGSINVSSRLSAFVAKPKPGEQVIDKPNAPLTTHHSPDLEKILAWKNNEFNFSDDDINTIMRQLARWYNIQPVITAPSQSNYTGRITRDVPLSEVLKMFEKLGYVKFEINDRVVRVIPTQ